MFLIVGNINLRFNTICLLIENNNLDGIFALQRTIFELQIAFEAYTNSEDKNKFVEQYSKKEKFETSYKWKRLIDVNNSSETPLFAEEVGIMIENWHSYIAQNLKKSTKRRLTSTWYELAANKSTRDLSYEFMSELDYFTSYDEPSNWVHPQRLEQNMDIDFNQRLEKHNTSLLLTILTRDVGWLIDDINRIRKYLKIEGNVKFKEYFEKMILFNNQLQSIHSKMLDE
ncbi:MULTISPECIES: DUF5677 domain-containing protein [unclassified Enterococcus]|uniref:DUF5677 domain-containing protein n=1 Tax=unclassified Enterococcus TaxID=2608891 RepID=UPI003F692505